MTECTQPRTDSAAERNPLIVRPDTPHGLPPFDRIRIADYEPAIDAALAEARQEVAAITHNPAEPTFGNTIVALERSGTKLDNIAEIFFALHSAETSPEMDEAAERIEEKLVAYANDINLDPVLFDRIATVYKNKETLSLDAEDSMLLERTYRSFVRGGAGLSDEAKERYRAITQELSALSLRFDRNVLDATNGFTLHIAPDEADRLEGLPDFVRESMQAEAAARGEEGWTVTLHAANYIPFLTYSPDRELKEQLWRAYNTRCIGDHDNRQIVLRTVALRLELARLFGYPDYASYVLEERMAGSETTVQGFLTRLLDATRQRALDEVTMLERYAREELYDADFRLMPWDWAYVAERYKQAHYALSNEEIKPYLELESVKQGIFRLAERLYGLRFEANPAIPVYHPDVTAYEAYEANGRFLGVLYMDFFPRATKKGGAWMTNYRPMYTTAAGEEIRPAVTLCGNFTKPTPTTPSLLTFDELETFLHEFGHCLHGLLAEGRYASLTGTSVYRDFVELPSQLMENWASEREFLDLFARHYRTGEPMPQELIDKIAAARNYLAAYSNLRQLGFGMTDMAWHTLTADDTLPDDVIAFEQAAAEPARVLPRIADTAMSPAFTHIFAGGYAAGYYGYKWAEVLEADAFALFRERGIFNREVADSFRRNILSKGGSEHPMTLYVRFRGHQPDPQALIDKILK